MNDRSKSVEELQDMLFLKAVEAGRGDYAARLFYGDGAGREPSEPFIQEWYRGDDDDRS